MSDYRQLQVDAERDGRRCVVGALICDGVGRVFVQRRAWNRALLPGCWDIVGGHVEAGESLLEALAREVADETGWTLVGTPQLLAVAEWGTAAGGLLREAAAPEGVRRRREFNFLVEVSGDLALPRLEDGKHVEFRWIGPADLDLLSENGDVDEGLLRWLVERAFERHPSRVEPRRHLTIFLDPAVSPPIEDLRRTWDPAMAEQIAAHITVTYPTEAPDIALLAKRLEHATASLKPFRLRPGLVACAGDPIEGVFIEVHDDDGGHRRLRDAVLQPPFGQRPTNVPHITLVHPRTSRLGRQAWQRLRGMRLDLVFFVREVAIVAFDGRRWTTVHESRLR